MGYICALRKRGIAHGLKVFGLNNWSVGITIKESVSCYQIDGESCRRSSFGDDGVGNQKLF